MQELVGQVLEGMGVSFGTAVDEVVVNIRPQDILAACRRAREDPRLDCDYLRCLSAVDYADRFELLYHFYSMARRHKAVFKVALPKVEGEPAVADSVISIWNAADWHEREIRDMFGISFRGHPHLVPLLMDVGLEDVHPLLKSYPIVPPRDIRAS
jgi:NADH-quinone oxidoreductase subunit C